jgi:hypothetical protein
MKARLPWSEGLINLWRITFSSSRNVEQLLTWNQLAWIGGNKEMPGFAFSGRQNGVKLFIGSHVVFSQESHGPWKIWLSVHQKVQQRFVDARYLWIEDLTTFEKSHFQANRMPNRGTVNTNVGESHAPWVSFFSQRNYLKILSQSPCTFSQGFRDVQWIGYLGHKFPFMRSQLAT